MIPARQLQDMIRTIRRFDEFDGSLIAYYGDDQCRILDQRFTPATNQAPYVLIEEVIETDPHIKADTLRHAELPGESPKSGPTPLIIANSSRVASEAWGAGLECTMTLVSAVALVGGVAGEVPTAGASTLVVLAAYAGLASSGLQCVNGLVRLTTAVVAPDDNTLQRWDNDKGLSTLWLIVDGLGLAAGVTSLPAGGKEVLALINDFGKVRGMTLPTLKAMNAAERGKLLRTVVAQASRSAAGTERLQALLKDAKYGTVIAKGAAKLSVNKAVKAAGIVSDQTKLRLFDAIVGVLSTPVSAAISGRPSSQVGSASGSVNWLVHVIDPDTESPP
jgi:hypothetical protein